MEEQIGGMISRKQTQRWIVPDKVNTNSNIKYEAKAFPIDGW